MTARPTGAIGAIGAWRLKRLERSRTTQGNPGSKSILEITFARSLARAPYLCDRGVYVITQRP